jgi:hypothetical protein
MKTIAELEHFYRYNLHKWSEWRAGPVRTEPFEDDEA